MQIRYGSKIGKNSDNVKDILYRVKKVSKIAENHYIWTMGSSTIQTQSVSESGFSHKFGEFGAEPGLDRPVYIDTTCPVLLKLIPCFFEASPASFREASRLGIVSQDLKRPCIR
jgi:hypothetical protein